MRTHEQVLISLRKIFHAIELHSKQIERESGLTGPQLLLMQLINTSGEITAGVLAREVSLSQATVTSIIDRLEHKGLLLRQRNTEDKRKVMVSLTATGKAALEKAPPLMPESFIKRFDQLEGGEQGHILSSLKQVGEMMNASNLDAAPLHDCDDGRLPAKSES
jgi:DNA-binding MarR family transcriptional regulator